jgi:23S rRNA G2445 N2-methylase RlmL
MKNPAQEKLREHYQLLRRLDPATLWSSEVTRFNSASARERMQLVSVVRAVGVVFSESGSCDEKERARAWLTSLLVDPEEKIRRYAMLALTKVGGGESGEAKLLELLEHPASSRENKFVAQTLERIGGEETLRRTVPGRQGGLAESAQRLRANIARKCGDGSLEFEQRLAHPSQVRVNLECRSGLEAFVLEELTQCADLVGVFRVLRSGGGRIELMAQKPFALGAVFAVRCFSEIRFPLAELPPLPKAGAPLEARVLADLIASDAAHRIVRAFTSGTVRYRLEFASRQADVALVRDIARKVYAARPELLNDPREALWEVCVRESAKGIRVDLRPRVRPDPRYAYRRGDVPAASHPPLAAAMARLAAVGKNERVWDPFCGSGLELVECALRGEVAEVFGCDLSVDAIQIAEANMRSAMQQRRLPRMHFAACDFRATSESSGMSGLRDLSLIVTNPPLGKRVPIADLRVLIGALFDVARARLREGGRLVFVNPLESAEAPPGLRLESRHKVDLGFAHFHLEKYSKRSP